MRTLVHLTAWIVLSLLTVSCSNSAVRENQSSLIENARIDGRSLLIDVVCGDLEAAADDFQLIITPASFQGRQPHHAKLLLDYPNSSGRWAIKYLTLRFDLSPVLHRYAKQGGEGEEIILDFVGSQTSVRYCRSF